MSQYSDYILAETGLVGYWRLGETSGTAAVDAKNSRDGTYTGGYTLNQSGLLLADSGAPSVDLNGTTGYVDIPDHADYSIFTTDELTVEIWADCQGVDGALFGKSAPSVSQYEWMVIQYAGYGGGLTGFQFAQPSHGGGAGAEYVMPSGVAVGTKHIAITFDYSTTTMIGYVNGVEVGRDTAWDNQPFFGDTASHVTIGQRGDDASWAFFPHRLQDFAIYNVAKSADKILEHYNMGVTGLSASSQSPFGMMGFFGV